MDYRSYHKDRLKTLIEANVQFDGQAISVNKYRTASSENFPYIFLSSGGMNGFDLYDTGTYIHDFGYQINIVWNLNDDEAKAQIVEASVDEIEGLLVDFLSTKKVRDSTDYPNDQNKWQDLQIVSVSEPYNGADIQFTEDTLVKSINILIKQPTNYA